MKLTLTRPMHPVAAGLLLVCLACFGSAVIGASIGVGVLAYRFVVSFGAGL